MKLHNDQVYPRIRMLLPSLTKTEQHIAEYFLTPHAVTKDTTINELAAELDVSNALIVKLAKKFGYDGFRELKIKLLQVEAQHDYFPNQPLTRSDDCAQVMQKILQNSVNCLQEVLSLSIVPKIEEAADLITEGKKLSIFAVGGTSVISDDFHHKLISIGITSYVPKDYHLMLMSASQMSSEDVVLVISHSGQTVDLLDAVEEARNAGAKIITITNNYSAALAEMSDISIFAPASVEPILGAGGSARLVKLAIIDCLFVTIANSQPDVTETNIEKTMQATRKLHVK